MAQVNLQDPYKQAGVDPLPLPEFNRPMTPINQPTAGGYTPGAPPNPGNNRESLHWERIPDAYRNLPNINELANNQNIDPNAEIQKLLSQQRSAGGKVNEDDAGALRGMFGGGGAPAAPPPPSPWAQLQMPGTQFDDPYTKLYEDTLQNALKSYSQPTAQVQQLMDFLNKQFQSLSQNPGYSPEQMAVLNTQAFEPIEQMRQASQQRTIERAGARGMLPSSGLIQGEQAQNDRVYDQMRTVANRDLAVNQINRQNADVQRALALAQMGVQVPQQQQSQALNVANLLYQLPRNSMMDSLQVLNASSPQSAISPYLQVLQQQQQQQQLQQQQDAAFWQGIGQLLAGL
jgi:hypothetical protein